MSLKPRKSIAAVETAEPMFRPEAVAEQQDRWLGTVLIVPKLSYTFYTVVALVLVTGIIFLLVFGEYTRKARIGGWLAPEAGLIEIVAPTGGVLVSLPVQEGSEVAAGAPLAILSGERHSAAMGATQGEVVRALRVRRDSLMAELEEYRALFVQQAAANEARLAALHDEAVNLEAEAALQQTRLSLAVAELDRRRDLLERSLTTEPTVLEAEKAQLDEALALQRLQRERSALATTRREIEAAVNEAPLQEGLKRAEISRAVASLDQEIAEAEAQREMVIAAPQNATVTALRAASGGSIASGAPLMTLVPAGAQLEALLYGPSRTIGFVRPGQRVQVRYEAYPYQKFGLYEGVVKSVSRAPVGAAELVSDQIGPHATGSAEPVYRVTVTLASQTAAAYGEAAPLQPGMKLQADVLIETRRLHEWILDPLYSLSGRTNA